MRKAAQTKHGKPTHNNAMTDPPIKELASEGARNKRRRLAAVECKSSCRMWALSSLSNVVIRERLLGSNKSILNGMFGAELKTAPQNFVRDNLTHNSTALSE
jgi:hypothetical protein